LFASFEERPKSGRFFVAAKCAVPLPVCRIQCF